MAVVYEVKNRLVEGYSPRKPPVWVAVKREGALYEVDLDGSSTRTVELFRIGTFAEAIDRTAEVIKEWTKAGKIPRPVFAIEGSQFKFWYSAHQIVNANRIMKIRHSGRKYMDKEGLERFQQDLKKVWYANRVVVNERGEIE